MSNNPVTSVYLSIAFRDGSTVTSSGNGTHSLRAAAEKLLNIADEQDAAVASEGTK